MKQELKYCVIFAANSIGSVVQWIVFQIPILKMQVRFLPGLQIIKIRRVDSQDAVPCLRGAVRDSESTF